MTDAEYLTSQGWRQRHDWLFRKRWVICGALATTEQALSISALMREHYYARGFKDGRIRGLDEAAVACAAMHEKCDPMWYPEESRAYRECAKAIDLLIEKAEAKL